MEDDKKALCSEEQEQKALPAMTPVALFVYWMGLLIRQAPHWAGKMDMFRRQAAIALVSPSPPSLLALGESV